MGGILNFLQRISDLSYSFVCVCLAHLNREHLPRITFADVNQVDMFYFFLMSVPLNATFLAKCEVY